MLAWSKVHVHPETIQSNLEYDCKVSRQWETGVQSNFKYVYKLHFFRHSTKWILIDIYFITRYLKPLG